MLLRPVALTTWESRLSELKKGLVPFDHGSVNQMRAAIRARPGFRENRDDGKMAMLRPCYIGESIVFTWHRPNHLQMKLAVDLFAITMVVTIGTDDELPLDIANSCKFFNLKHRRLDFKDANEESLKTDE